MSTIERSSFDSSNSDDKAEDILNVQEVSARLMRIPPMPLSDDVFYQPGLYSKEKTSFIDSRGNPIFRSILVSSDQDNEMILWIDQHRSSSES